MIVDDESIIRHLISEELRTSLEPEPLLIEAANGEEALAALDEDFHLVLTDLRMPKLGGLELIARVKERSPLTEIIVVTGYATLENAIEALRQGAYDYLLKPFEQLDLVSFAVRNAVQKSMLERERLELTARLRDLNLGLEQKVRRRTRELRATNQRLFELNRRIEEFLALFAHDLKTQVTTTEGLLSILAEDHAPSLDENGRECVSLCLSQVQAMRQVIIQSLQYSQVNLMTDQYTSVSINELLDAAIGFCQREMEERRIKIILDNQVDVLTCDRDKLYHAFITLLDQMIALADGGKRSYLKITVRQQRGRVVFVLEDNGVGMRKDDLAHIFHKLRRESPDRPGFSMPVVRKIVESHGGTIEIQSVPGKELRYVLELPVKPFSPIEV